MTTGIVSNDGTFVTSSQFSHFGIGSNSKLAFFLAGRGKTFIALSLNGPRGVRGVICVPHGSSGFVQLKSRCRLFCRSKFHN